MSMERESKRKIMFMHLDFLRDSSYTQNNMIFVPAGSWPRGNKTRGGIIVSPAYTLACVASVSVGFGSKERPRNGVFGILPARKMGREPKKEWWG